MFFFMNQIHLVLLICNLFYFIVNSLRYSTFTIFEVVPCYGQSTEFIHMLWASSQSLALCWELESRIWSSTMGHDTKPDSNRFNVHPCSLGMYPHALGCVPHAGSHVSICMWLCIHMHFAMYPCVCSQMSNCMWSWIQVSVSVQNF
jgi:hypothetical protein